MESSLAWPRSREEEVGSERSTLGRVTTQPMSSGLSVDERLKGRTASGCQVRLVRASKAGQLASLDSFVDTSSKSKNWGKELSPFILGPVDLYDGHVSQCVENAWQYCKVYGHMCDEKGDPTPEYWEWAQEGWANPKAKRFPLGKGSKPAYSFWDGKKLGYMDARLQIYCTLYAQAVKKSPAFERLKQLTEKYDEVILSDPDAVDYIDAGKTLKEALFDTSRPLSHSLVLAMLLCDVPVWEEFLAAQAESADPSST